MSHEELPSIDLYCCLPIVHIIDRFVVVILNIQYLEVMKNLFLFWLTISSLITVHSSAVGQTMTGRVFIDINASGDYDISDRTISGVSVQLFDQCDNGSLLTTTSTDNNGYYSFNVDLGEYTVKLDPNDPVYKNGSHLNQNCCFSISDPTMSEICNLGVSLPDCNSHPFSSDNFCDNGSFLMDLKLLGSFPCANLPSESGNWNGQSHCNGIYQNTTFFSFIAGSGNYGLNISIFQCAGKGMQYGIMETCNPNGPYVICNGNANTGLLQLDLSSLQPCKKYVLWLDGLEGSICSYYITTTGDFNICDPTNYNLDPLEIDFNLSLACDPDCNHSFEKTLSIISKDSLPKIDSFIWSITNSVTIISTTTTEPNLDVTGLASGVYDICVRIDSSLTYGQTNYCKQITIEENYEIVKNTFTLCETELPWFGASDNFGNKLLDVFGNHWRWTKGPIIWSDLKIGKNTFINDRLDNCGCSYKQEITIIYHVRGQACDDNDDTTVDDIVLDDCTCSGTPTSGITGNTSWYYRPFALTPSNEIWQVKTLRDTLIANQIYTIVGLDRGNGVIKQTEIPLAQVNGKMYFHENGEAKLLYNFNAEVGEVVTYFVPKVQRFYDVSSNGGFTQGLDKPYKLIIDKIDTLVTQNGKQLKLFHTTATERYVDFHVFQNIIEGVGGSLGLFGAFGPFLPSGTEGSIRCFQNEEGIFSVSNDDCKIVNIIDHTITTPFHLYPNPADNFVNITGIIQPTTELQIFDINQKIIVLPTSIELDKIRIDTYNIPNGIYFILLKSSDIIYPMKFIKSN